MLKRLRHKRVMRKLRQRNRELQRISDELSLLRLRKELNDLKARLLKGRLEQDA